MQYMEAVKGDEDPGSSHSDEEEDGDHSGDDGEAIAAEQDVTGQRIGPDHNASAEDHDPGATARGPNLDHGRQKDTAIGRPSPVDEPLEESTRSIAGPGASPAARNVSVETGLRNLQVSEVDVLEKGE